MASYLSQLRVDTHDPDVMSHILMVSSQEPLTRMLGLSGLKATQFTSLLLKHTKLVLKQDRKYSLEREGTYLCPLRVDTHDPDVMSHILMVLSEEPLTRMLGLSGLKATQLTTPLLKHTKLVLKNLTA